MNDVAKNVPGTLLLGNESISRGALEAGVSFAAGYPGTPSSEIIESLARQARKQENKGALYVEWSINEKVAAEECAAAAISGLRSLVSMKNAGLSVALDFLTHLSYSGLGEGGGAMVVVVCDDPDGHSSGDETDSRWLARFASAPLLEPGCIQEAREMMLWAFEISAQYKCYVIVRGYTRLSHASSVVELKELSKKDGKKAFMDTTGCLSPYIARSHHADVLSKMNLIRRRFEDSPFNRYEGPERPELIVICGGSGISCSQEAVEALRLEDSVGFLKLGTLWPFPKNFVEKHLSVTNRVLVAEEVDPFIETLVKEAMVDKNTQGKTIYGKASGHIPMYGEMTPDRVIRALTGLFDIHYEPVPSSYREGVSRASRDLLISRGLTWCPGCPHRASFMAVEKAIKTDGRDAYVTGDIGCYTLDVFPEGKNRMKVLHAMGSGTGLASGFGQLERFGLNQPIVAICGDSTFFHASVPALINAVHNRSNMIQIVLDNGATAMTGFQPHPGTDYNAFGEQTTPVDMEKFCLSLGCSVTVSDPFDIKGTTRKLRKLLRNENGEKNSVRVLILRRTCELVRMRDEKSKPFKVLVHDELCKGEACGVCSKSFRCPALVIDSVQNKAQIREDACSGCGVCVEVCPFSAISKEDVKQWN
jgi:indolepyruvate ferredoxin oxidoreductase alpha subunit